MRQPLRRKTKAPAAQVSTVRSYPPPVGGWNARDSLAAMKPTDAVTLNNWFPTPSYVEFRGGSASHATGTTNNGKTLMVYNGLSTNKLFVATASGIYDASSAGAVASAVLARTNGKHQYEMFGDGTNNWLIACNGVDDPAYYDGTTWTAVDETTSPALTGYTSNNVHQFVQVKEHKGRLYFIPISSLSFWYLAAGAAGGALTEFDLSGEASRGGYIMTMCKWTRDGGDGLDDVAVFITSEGEAIIYQGNNPSSSTSWAKVGTFFIGKPLGRRCATQYGSDVIVLTENGTFELSKALQTAAEEQGKFALSNKIEKPFTEAALSYGSTFGWQATVYPAHNALLVNVPIAEDGEHQQYVMNTTTKAWTKFTDWDAECFAVFNGELYFANGTAVYKAWTGTADGDNSITFYGKQAFMDFGDPNPKQVKMFMPILSTNGNIAYGADVDVDFNDDEITGTVSYNVVAGAKWDVDNWDEAYWASGMEITKQWSSPAEWEGRWLSGKVKIVSNSLLCQWIGSSMIWERGSGL